MAYSDFTLNQLQSMFQISLLEVTGLFKSFPPKHPTPWLVSFLQRNVPLALAINTEKARSEFIIAQVVLEIKEMMSDQISVFSGNDFNVDSSLGLNGRVDFLFSRNPLQLQISVPVVTIVEAKNEKLNDGIPQCIAELIAAQRFNQLRGNHILPLYGAITTGNLWKFLQLEERVVTIDLNEYPIEPIEVVFGILYQMVVGKDEGRSTSPASVILT